MIFGFAFTYLLFYVVAAFMILAALCTVISKNILQSAIFLIATFIGTAILYILLQAEFMAMAQIMVYAGGVVVFMIFAILLTSHLGETFFNVQLPRKFIAGIITLVFLFLMVKFLIPLDFNSVQELSASSGTSLKAYAERLLSDKENGFLIPFELISLLLLMTLIVSVTLAKIKDPEDK